MPENKNQRERLRILYQMLYRNEITNHSTFMAKLQSLGNVNIDKVNPRTIARDIKLLQTEYNAPIEYNYKDRSWNLTQKGWYHRHLCIEPNVTKAAILSERIAGRFMPAMQDDIEKAINTLISKTGTGLDKDADLNCFQVLHPEFQSIVPASIFLSAYEAWEKHHKIQIEYTNHAGKSSVKIFEPHVFAWHENNWYLKGHVTRNNQFILDPPQIRVLALHRISKITNLFEKFKTNRSLIEDVKKNGLFDLPKYEKVILEFYGNSARKMTERFANTPQLVKKAQEDFLRVEIKSVNQPEIEKLLLTSGGEFKIISPIELKEEICSIAQTILKNNS